MPSLKEVADYHWREHGICLRHTLTLSSIDGDPEAPVRYYWFHCERCDLYKEIRADRFWRN